MRDPNTFDTASPLHMAEAIATCRRIVAQPAFRAQVGVFIKQNCNAFDLSNADENKLSYTPLHEQYVEVVDLELTAALQETMGPAFDMAAFLAAVPAFVQSSAGRAANVAADAAAGAAVDVSDGTGELPDEADAAAALSVTLEELQRFSDFECFKECMLQAKREKIKEAEMMAAAQAKYFAVMK